MHQFWDRKFHFSFSRTFHAFLVFPPSGYAQDVSHPHRKFLTLLAIVSCSGFPYRIRTLLSLVQGKPTVHMALLREYKHVEPQIQVEHRLSPAMKEWLQERHCLEMRLRGPSPQCMHNLLLEDMVALQGVEE